MYMFRQKWHPVACLILLSQLSILVLGCGGLQPPRAQPALTLKTSSVRIQPLDDIEALVASKDFDGAATQLKTIEIGAVPPGDRDRLAYLTARITLAQTPKAGCRQMASYAQTTKTKTRKNAAAYLAIRCLKAPISCPQIEALSRPLLSDLVAMTKQNVLPKRLRCNNLQEVVDALVTQHAQFTRRTTPTALQGTDQILAALDGKSLKALVPHLKDNPILQQQIRLRLLSHFLPILSEFDQQSFVSSLPNNHPIRIAWETSPRGNRVLVCLPLTGSFGAVGQMVRTQLIQLQTGKPVLFRSRLEFFDCTDKTWSAEAFDKALSALSARFVLSLTDTALQARLSQHLGSARHITHFTLNPIFPGTVVPSNTWTLNVSPDLLVGTLITDMLVRLNRKKATPLPVRLLLITDPLRRTPIQRYLEQYARSFTGFKTLSVPAECDEELTAKSCASQQQQQWMVLAQKVARLTHQNERFETLYLDLEPESSVSFLKYFASEKAGPSTSPTRSALRRNTNSPIIYSNHRPLQAPESQITLRLDEGHPPKRVLRNRYTRLAGAYSNDIRYLVHFNPLSEAGYEFLTSSTDLLGKAPRPEVTTIVESLRLIDVMAQTGRKAEVDRSVKPVRNTVFQQGHTSGLSVSPKARTLPRLSILVTKDGYFIEQ